MFRHFLKSKDGNYASILAILMAPLIGGVALAIDYTELTRHKTITMQALDAAGLAAAQEMSTGKTDEEVEEYARNFFEANLGRLDRDTITLTVDLPDEGESPRILKLDAQINFQPYFLPVFAALMGHDMNDGTVKIDANFQSAVRLKNTSEIALVLDNSGSMEYNGAGTGETRLSLLKNAAKTLVEKISADAKAIKQLNKAAQFSVVPFASSVNVGSNNASEDWMDKDGKSSIHHENFDWTTLTDPDFTYQVSGTGYKKEGSGWGDEEGEYLTRFTLYDHMKRIIDESDGDWVCTDWYGHGGCKDGYYDNKIYEYGSYASWAGCVESRPYPWNVDDTEPKSSNPDTLFVPMFAPDEADGADAYNSWWIDDGGSSWADKQENMSKYFVAAPIGTGAIGSGDGPNLSCTTQAITPLTDTTKTSGLETIKDAIDAMQAKGGTNVTEGIAWGWRTLSSGAPFTEGRNESDDGNDKVIIVLTDGANTYYTPKSLGRKDLAANKSIYSAYGYTKTGYGGSPKTRLFLGTSSDVSNSYSNSNYSTAMNEHMEAVCTNAKDGDVMIFVVALDLDETDDADMLDALESCSSYSKIWKNKKLFWNTQGDDLDDAFNAIVDELANLHIIG